MASAQSADEADLSLVREQLVRLCGEVRVESERRRQDELLICCQRRDAVAGPSPRVDVLVRVSNEHHRGVLQGERVERRRDAGGGEAALRCSYGKSYGPVAAAASPKRERPVAQLAKDGQMHAPRLPLSMPQPRSMLRAHRITFWFRKSFIVIGVISCASSCGPSSNSSGVRGQQ